MILIQYIKLFCSKLYPHLLSINTFLSPCKSDKILKRQHLCVHPKCFTKVLENFLIFYCMEEQRNRNIFHAFFARKFNCAALKIEKYITLQS